MNSVADLVVEAKRRLVYFTQLSYVLGGMSLVVAVLLVGTLLTITVNERLGRDRDPARDRRGPRHDRPPGACRGRWP